MWCLLYKGLFHYVMLLNLNKRSFFMAAPGNEHCMCEWIKGSPLWALGLSPADDARETNGEHTSELCHQRMERLRHLPWHDSPLAEGCPQEHCRLLCERKSRFSCWWRAMPEGREVDRCRQLKWEAFIILRENCPPSLQVTQKRAKCWLHLLH